MIINTNKNIFNKKYIDKIYEGYSVALDILKVPTKELEVNLKFVSGNEIKKLNNEFRQKDAETDVLSFPNLLEYGKTDMQLIIDRLTKENYQMDINPESGAIMLGDICICKKVAYAHAKEYGNSKMREIVYMAIHGLLHLLGYDHMIEEDKKIMREVEEKIMTAIDLRRD